MRREKKAVSEVVAAMMLISIVVAAAFIIYVYSSNLLGMMTGAQPSSGQYSNQITLEYYDWTNTQSGVGAECSISYAAQHNTAPICSSLILGIRNVGSGLANIAAYYINGVNIPYPSSSTCTSLTGTVTVTTNVASITRLMPQLSCTVTLTMPTTATYTTATASTATGLTITVGDSYSLQIATTSGGVFTYTLVAGERTGSY